MKKIIIIEDDLGLQEAFNIVFDTAVFDVTMLTNANPVFENAIAIPDLFILDKQLSGVDGLEVCRFLKKNAATKDVPVIMLSASPHIGKLAQVAGADGALEKPFKLDEFRDMVERLI